MHRQIEMFPDVVEQMLNDALEHIHPMTAPEEVIDFGQEEVQQEEEGHEEDDHEDQRGWDRDDLN